MQCAINLKRSLWIHFKLCWHVSRSLRLSSFNVFEQRSMPRSLRIKYILYIVKFGIGLLLSTIQKSPSYDSKLSSLMHYLSRLNLLQFGITWTRFGEMFSLSGMPLGVSCSWTSIWLEMARLFRKWISNQWKQQMQTNHEANIFGMNFVLKTWMLWNGLWLSQGRTKLTFSVTV